MFVFSSIFLPIGVLVWNLLERRKRPFHRASPRNAPSSLAIYESRGTKSLPDEDEKPPEGSEDAENDGNLEGKWYDDSAD